MRVPVIRSAQVGQDFERFTDWTRASADVVAGLGSAPATTVADAMDRFGVICPDVHALVPGSRCVGSALTVLTRGGDNAAVHEALGIAEPGDVLVVSQTEVVGRALFGELMTIKALNRGLAGLVLDGYVRDVGGIDGHGLPVFARGASAAGPYKSGPGKVGVPVACGGVVCRSGDVVVADDDGVVVVPYDRADAVAARAAAICTEEVALREALTTLEEE